MKSFVYGTENGRRNEGRKACIYTERKKLTIGRSLIQLCLQEEPLYTLETGGGALIFNEKRKEVNNIFHSFCILWTR